MKYKGLKRAIVMLLALTMLVTSSGIVTFAESLNEEAANPTKDAVTTEQTEEAQEDAAKADEANGEAVKEDAKEEAKEEAKDEVSDKAADEKKLTAKDWKKDLPKDVSKDVREAMSQVAKSQVGDEADLYKAFANADSIKDGDASFVMFVLEYANVLGVKKAIGDDSNGTVKSGDLEIPVNADIKKWVKELKNADIYKEVEEESQPEQGDIVFTSSILSTDAAVVLSADEGKLEVAGIETEKKEDKVSKYTVDAEKVDGFVSLKDIAPEEFTEEQAEESVEEAKEEASDAEKAEDADKADEEAKEAEEAKTVEEPVEEEQKYDLSDQTIKAEITSAPGIGGKLKSVFKSNKGTKITVSGMMPEGAYVKAYPVDVEVPGQNVITAYDITIYVKNENGKEEEWQPSEPLNVVIKDNKIEEAAGEAKSDAFGVFHMKNADSVAKEIEVSKAANGAVKFEAESFSIYVVTAELENVLTSTDGKTYKITVRYDEGAKIPDDAELRINEVDPVDHYQETKALLDEDRINILSAHEISIITDHNGKITEIQPKEAVQVSIELIGQNKADARKAAYQKIVHIGDNSKDVIDPSVSMIGDNIELGFATEGFSIYEVVEIGPHETYKFVDSDGSEYDRQIVGPGDKLVKPSVPVHENEAFIGWFEVTGTNPETLAEKPFDDFGVHETIEDGKTITLKAQFDASIYITYYDQNGNVMQVDKADEVVLTVDDLEEGEEGMEGKVNPDRVKYVPYDKEGESYDFKGWALKPGETKPSKKVEAFEPTHNVSLYPILAAGQWMYFDSNAKGTGATYTAPIFVPAGTEPGKDGTMPANPTRDGYTFAGWWTTATDLGEEVFDNTPKLTNPTYKRLTQRLNLYAHWTAEPKADYTVIIWRQKLNDTGTEVSNEYAYEESFVVDNQDSETDLSLPAAYKNLQTVDGFNYLNAEHSGTNKYARKDPDNPNNNHANINASDNSTDNPYYGFKFARIEKQNTFAAQSHNAEEFQLYPNGSSVINVYYDREEFELKFYSFSQNNNGTYGRDSNENYYPIRGGSYYYTYTYNGIESNYWGDLYTRSGSEGNYTYTVATNFNANSTYYGKVGDGYLQLRRYSHRSNNYTRSEVNSFTRPYGVKLENVFPVKISGTDDYYEYTESNPKVRWRDISTPPVYPSVIAKMPSMPGQNMYFAYNDGGRRNVVTLHYMVESLDTTGTYDLDGKKYNQFYQFKARYGQLYRTDDVVPFEGKEHKFTGVIVDARTGQKKIDNDTGWSTNDSGKYFNTGVNNATQDSTGEFYIFYNRKQYNLVLKYGKNAGRLEGDEIDSTQIKYEYEVSPDTTIIANGNTTVETAAANPQNDLEGYEFTGWYLDEDCKVPAFKNEEDADGHAVLDENGDHVKVPFTMPANNLVLYAGFEPVYYKVTLEPDKGQLEHGSSTWFWVPHGEKITEYTPTRNFIKAEGEGEKYSYVQFKYDENDPENEANRIRDAKYIKDSDIVDNGDGSFTIPHENDDYTITDYRITAEELDKGLVTIDPGYIYEPNAYSFAGWHRVIGHKDNGDPILEARTYRFSTPTKNDVDLVAQWQPLLVYNVKYELTDEDGEDLTDIGYVEAPEDKASYTGGARAQVRDLIKSDKLPYGKQFLGWKIKGSKDKTIYQPNESFVVKEEDSVKTVDPDTSKATRTITLIPVIEDDVVSHHVRGTYYFMNKVKNEETGEYEWKTFYEEIVYGGELLSQPPATPTYQGTVAEGEEVPEFVGWYEDANLTHRFDGFGIVKTPPEEKYLYASFEKQIHVTYHAATDTGNSDQIISVQNYPPSGTEKLDTTGVGTSYIYSSNYNLCGWTEGNQLPLGATQADADYPFNDKTETLVTHDIDLYPVMESGHTLSFDTLGGGPMPSKFYRTTENTVRPAKNPQKGDEMQYTFIDWFVDRECETKFEGWGQPLADNLMLYAGWTDNNKPDKTKVTVLYWIQNADGESYYIPENADDDKNGKVEDWGTPKRTYNLKTSTITSKINSILGAEKSYFEFEKVTDRNGEILTADSSGNYSTESTLDNAAVLNVYVQRKSFDMAFEAGNGSFNTAKAKTDSEKGTELSGKTYTLKNVWLGKNIADIWPDASYVNGPDENNVFVSWQGSNNTYGIENTATKELLTDGGLDPSASSPVATYTANYANTVCNGSTTTHIGTDTPGDEEETLKYNVIINRYVGDKLYREVKTDLKYSQYAQYQALFNEDVDTTPVTGITKVNEKHYSPNMTAIQNASFAAYGDYELDTAKMKASENTNNSSDLTRYQFSYEMLYKSGTTGGRCFASTAPCRTDAKFHYHEYKPLYFSELYQVVLGVTAQYQHSKILYVGNEYGYNWSDTQGLSLLTNSGDQHFGAIHYNVDARYEWDGNIYHEQNSKKRSISYTDFTEFSSSLPATGEGSRSNNYLTEYRRQLTDYTPGTVVLTYHYKDNSSSSSASATKHTLKLVVYVDMGEGEDPFISEVYKDGDITAGTDISSLLDITNANSPKPNATQMSMLIPSDKNVDDYEFKGWSVNNDNTLVPYSQTKMPASDLTLYAVVKPLEVSVTTKFQRPGDDTPITETRYREKGSQFGTFDIPQPTLGPNETFVGWKDEATNEYWESNMPVSEDIIVNAIVIDNSQTFHIYYDLGDGNVISGKTPVTGTTLQSEGTYSDSLEGTKDAAGKWLDGKNYAPGAEVPVSGIVQGTVNSPKGYNQFVYWKDAHDNTYVAGDMITIPKDGHITLYANYARFLETTLIYRLNLKNRTKQQEVVFKDYNDPDREEDELFTNSTYWVGTKYDKSVVSDNPRDKYKLWTWETLKGDKPAKLMNPGYHFIGWLDSTKQAAYDSETDPNAKASMLWDNGKTIRVTAPDLDENGDPIKNYLIAQWEQDKLPVKVYKEPKGESVAEIHSGNFTISGVTVDKDLPTWTPLEFKDAFRATAGNNFDENSDNFAFRAVMVGDDVADSLIYVAKDDESGYEWQYRKSGEKKYNSVGSKEVSIRYSNSFDLTVKTTVDTDDPYSNPDEVFSVKITLKKADTSEEFTEEELAALEGFEYGDDHTTVVRTVPIGDKAPIKPSVVVPVLYKWKYTVEETDNRGYNVTYQKGITGETLGKATTTAPSDEQINGNTTVQINNGRTKVVPTGISGHMNMLMLIVLAFVLATAEFYILMRRRRVSR